MKRSISPLSVTRHYVVNNEWNKKKLCGSVSSRMFSYYVRLFPSCCWYTPNSSKAPSFWCYRSLWPTLDPEKGTSLLLDTGLSWRLKTCTLLWTMLNTMGNDEHAKKLVPPMWLAAPSWRRCSFLLQWIPTTLTGLMNILCSWKKALSFLWLS